MVSASGDNAAVLVGNHLSHWAPDYSTGSWKATEEILDSFVNVETLDHPTVVRAQELLQAWVVKSETKRLLDED